MRLFTILCVAACSWTSIAMAQSQEKVYATLILNFARGIQWPDHALSADFTIGVLEYPPLAAELTAGTATIKVGAKKIRVIEVTSLGQVENLDILFVPAYKAKMLPDILSKLGSAPTLIVTNKINLARQGSGVNFVLVDGKLRYEINCKTIEERGMKISANIKGMGIVVN